MAYCTFRKFMGKKDEKWGSPVPVPLWFEQVQQALGVELIVLDDNLGLECNDYEMKGIEKVCEQIKNGLSRPRDESNKKETILYIVAISRSTKLSVGFASLNVLSPHLNYINHPHSFLEELATIKPVVDNIYKPFFNHIGCLLLTASTMTCVKTKFPLYWYDASEGFYNQFIKYKISSQLEIGDRYPFLHTPYIKSIDDVIPPESFYREKFPDLFFRKEPDYDSTLESYMQRRDLDAGRNEYVHKQGFHGLDIDLPRSSIENDISIERDFFHQKEVNRIEKWLDKIPNSIKGAHGAQWRRLAGKDK